MNDSLEAKVLRLRELLSSMSPLIVAYSGGVDSAVVLAEAVGVLGQEKVLGCIGVSPSYPVREKDAAMEVAGSMGARVRLVETDEHLDERYAANPADRCYWCKTHLHDRLLAISAAEGFKTVVDGNNASDDVEDRPGMKAAVERGVRSPLREAGITKSEVRELAKARGLVVWDKPAAPCLSSRVPTGTAITVGLLGRIEAAEGAMAGMGFRQFRVRDRGEIARVQVSAGEWDLAKEHLGAITDALRTAGYREVVLDENPLVRE